MHDTTTQAGSGTGTKAVTDATFATEVLQSELPVLVDFWAIWCTPCKAIAPVVEKFSQEMEGKLKVMKLDTDENQTTAMQYGIRSIPTLMLFKGGQPVDAFIGFKPNIEVALREWLGKNGIN